MRKYLKVTFWVITGAIGIMMLFSAYSYLGNPEMEQAFKHLGFPSYFRVELAIAKIIGAVLLLVPVKGRIKDWVYAGFAFTFVSAALAHISVGDPIAVWIAPLVFLGLLTISYALFVKGEHHMNKSNNQ